MRRCLAIAFAAALSTTTIGSSALAQAKADIAKGQQLAGQVCAACHAADGNSTIAQNPVLAGQVPEYLHKQLKNFKAAANAKADRVNAVMAPMVANLTEQDMQNLAAYYAAQSAKTRNARNKDLVGLGQQIYRAGIPEKSIPACAGCHGVTGVGMPAQYPRLAGQHAEYTEAQMKAWRSGERANDPSRMMRTIAARMSDKEIIAVSDFIAGLR